jgi:hypothetical protein
MSSGAAGKEWKNVTVSYNGELCFRACAAGNHDQERQEKEMTESAILRSVWKGEKHGLYHNGVDYGSRKHHRASYRHGD